MKLFTIGFTKKPAKVFFSLIKESGAARLIDVRLNNTSQLAGFAKRDDLQYFLQTICGITYHHLPQFAPTKELLKDFRRTKSWDQYEKDFLALMSERQTEKTDPTLLDNACLLCSEPTPEHCHRRLVAEYLKTTWPDLDIIHL